jgi:hypothetical protein
VTVVTEYDKKYSLKYRYIHISSGKQPLGYRPRDPLPSQMIPMEVVISEEEQEEVEDSKTPSQMAPMKVIIGEEEQEEVEDSKTVDMFTHTSACMGG